MGVVFREFSFRNDNGIDVAVTLEAPLGTQVVAMRVGPGKTEVRQLEVENASTARITAAAQGHEPFPDVQTLDLSKSGSPFATLIETVRVHSRIGAIHGEVVARF